jgi:hypothetical protein
MGWLKTELSRRRRDLLRATTQIGPLPSQVKAELTRFGNDLLRTTASLRKWLWDEVASSLPARLAAAMMALVVLTAAIAGFLNYRQVAAVAIPRALERIDKHDGLLAAELEASMRGPWADVNTQGEAVQGLVRAHLAGGRDPVAGTAEAEWHQRLASRFAAELTARPTYVRYCEGFRMPAHRDGWAVHRGRRPKASREGTRE